MQTFLKRFGPGFLAVAVVLSSFGGGLYVGSQKTYATSGAAVSVLNGESGKKSDVDFSPFWKAWDVLNQKYVPTHEKPAATDQEKVWGAIQGLAASYGDPYTTFFPPVENKDFQSQISGNFEGVGMEVDTKDKVIVVVSALKNTPAEKAGMKTGDRILTINGTSTVNMAVEEAVKLIRGPKGTTVTLMVLPEKATRPKEVKITRDVINTPTIETELRSDGVFVIHLYTFTENSATLFRQAIQKFVQTKSNKLVLDLRGNPGGYLDAAVDMASWFLPKDALVVKEATGGKGQDVEYKSLGYNLFNKSLKMVILVDGGSASASEILSGALQEHGVAKLVGTKTFGKGSVQELVPITKDTSLKVTIARWLTPNGNSISEKGLTPDVEVQLTEDDVKNKNDLQLKKAVEILNQ
jgi:carboxyl-terminal processing protease